MTQKPDWIGKRARFAFKVGPILILIPLVVFILNLGVIAGTIWFVVTVLRFMGVAI